VNSTTRNLARMAASVVRESSACGLRMDANDMQRNLSHSVRARLNVAISIGLATYVIAPSVRRSKPTRECDQALSASGFFTWS